MPPSTRSHPVIEAMSRYRDVEEKIFYVIPRDIEEEIDSLVLEANSRFSNSSKHQEGML